MNVVNSPEIRNDPDQLPKDIFETGPDFERFDQRNEMFCRSQWDERVRSKKAIAWFRSMLTSDPPFRDTDGYTQKDYALRNAGWAYANLTMERTQHLGRRDAFLDDITPYLDKSKTRYEVTSPEAMAEEVRQVGKLLGADLVGFTRVDIRWHYSNRYDADNKSSKPNDLPEHLVNCIVIGTEMPYEVLKTYPSALAGVGPGLGYSKDAFVLQLLSQFIRNLGYDAVASLNDTAQAIPYAVQAGLAEYGRNGLAITPEFGPRVRFGKIFTDLPLKLDKPIRFGVKEFCSICRKCADACPAKAIPFDGPVGQPINDSNIKGVNKWTVDGEKCFSIWANQGTECGICIRVCPYNKGHKTFSQRVYRRFFLAMAFSPLRSVALWLDGVLGFGERKKPSWWWRTRPE